MECIQINLFKPSKGKSGASSDYIPALLGFFGVNYE